MTTRPTLILRLESPSMPSREWEITNQGMGIGRLDDSDITLPDKSVSRQHARIVPTSSGFDVEDLGSTNGTWLNDKQVVDRMPLSNGDQLVVGDVPLRVVLRGAVPAVVVTPPPEGGPSTVYYDLDDALADAKGTSLDVVPDRNVEQRTLIAAEPTPAPVSPPPEPRPAPLLESRPAPPAEPAFEPRPTAQAEPAFEPRPAEAATAPGSAEPTTLTLIELADRLATALRVVKGDTRLALWLFEQAGGRAAAHNFVRQAQRAEANPDNPIEQARVLDLAPTAARLLEAAVMLANVVSTFQSPDNEPQADAPNLEPVTRP